MPPSDIFIQGKLEMSAVPVQEAAQAMLWDDFLLNRVLVVAAVLIGIAGLRDLLRLLPELLYCFSRPRASVSLEYNTSVVRMRNTAALISILPFCLLADRFGLFRPELWSAVPEEWSAPATVGVFLAYLLLRTVCSALIRLPRLSGTAADAVRRSPWNYFILLTLLMLLTVGLLYIFRPSDTVVRITLYAETALFFLLSLLRSGQILASGFSGLTTILYLCGLELLPAAALAAYAVFL
ncbi:MAG: DUF4271 domain-containing protein [Bacteroidetes bacterium]|uniref:DUF4271 domain-containing protein n=1 Tax=Candidatus Cryptobacteroides avistercoris TaxID=2840758 RepID=A0A9D9IXQ3_9BACT|nr:DUF4271 domain-containing protein [Candidatus Cryptobacteroides avistercoris]